MLDNLTICIPTSHRAGVMTTLNWIPKKLYKNTHLFLHKSELKDYSDYNVTKQTHSLSNLALIRDKAVQRCTTRYLYLIDDNVKFRYLHEKASEKDMLKFFKKQLEWLTHVPMVGPRHPFMITKKVMDEKEYETDTRTAYAFGIDLDILKKHNFKFAILPEGNFSSDQHMALNFIEHGYHIWMSNRWTIEKVITSNRLSSGCNANGRNEKTYEDSLRLLAKYHPYVKLKRQKNWNRNTSIFRTDLTLTIYWKRSFGIKSKNPITKYFK